MLKMYWKTAWRNLSRHPVYSGIHLVGLTIGLSACLLVAAVVIDDLSYDRQWSHSNDLYRINSISKMGEGLYDRSSYSFAGLANTLRTRFPEVAAVSQMYTYQERLRINDMDANGAAINALHADTSVWRMLDLHVITGRPQHYVAGQDNMVITESFQRRFFPHGNPIGRTIYTVPTFGERSAYLITGVIRDLPSNTIFRADAVILGEGSHDLLNKNQNGTFLQQFVLLQPGTVPRALSDKLNRWYRAFVESKNPYQFELQPLRNLYLHSDFAQGQAVRGSYAGVFVFSGIAALLLLIACVNFINLSTARAVNRMAETGVRKVLGARRKDLIGQFLTESLVFFGLSAMIATVIYFVSVGALERFVGHPLRSTLEFRLALLCASYGSMLLISFFTGLYPAWILSSYRPVQSLKGQLVHERVSVGQYIRKGLVVVQFAIAVVIVTGLVVVHQQIRFIEKKDLGFDQHHLLYINPITWDGKGSVFKNELLRQPGVVRASISAWGPAMGAGSMSREIPQPGQPNRSIIVYQIFADIDFAATLGLHLEKGRLLDPSYGNDAVSSDSISDLSAPKYLEAANRQSSLITNYTARVLQVPTLNEPIKDVMTRPVGVIADFHTLSLKDPLKPTVIVADPTPSAGGLFVRTQPGATQDVPAAIYRLWKQYFPDKLLDLHWVDDVLADQYQYEHQLQQLFTFFSGVSLLLAAMGLFGLAVQSTHQRVKEIGIRKVLGASVSSIVRLFTTEFLRPVAVAVAIALPVGYLLMNRWLTDFAYRISLQWWMFGVAGITVLAIALITVSFQSVKAAVANPVRNLRAE